MYFNINILIYYLKLMNSIKVIFVMTKNHS